MHKRRAGLLGDLDEAVESEEIAFEKNLEGRIKAPATVERLRGWFERIVSRSLSLVDAKGAGDLTPEYWAILGRAPRSAEEQRAAYVQLTKEVMRLLHENLAESERHRVHEFRELRERYAQFEDEHGEERRTLERGIRLRLTSTFAEDLEARAERLLHLQMYAVYAKLPPQVAELLDHIARLYVDGYRTEVAVVARSVLECALKHAQSDSDVRLALNFAPEREINMKLRIDAAYRAGFLSALGKDYADVLRVKGNLVLHETADTLSVVGGPIGIIQRAVRCVSELMPS